MLKQIRWGFIDLIRSSRCKPQALTGVIIAALGPAVINLKIFIEVGKTPATFFALTLHGNFNPAIGRHGLQLPAHRFAGIQIHQLIKVAVGKADINGVEHRITAHNFGKQFRGSGVNPVTVHQIGMAGQNTNRL